MWDRGALAVIADLPATGEPVDFEELVPPLFDRHPGDEEEDDLEDDDLDDDDDDLDDDDELDERG